MDKLEVFHANQTSMCILGHVWYLIVSISDLCRLSYFDVSLGFKQTIQAESRQLHSFTHQQWLLLQVPLKWDII